MKLAKLQHSTTDAQCLIHWVRRARNGDIGAYESLVRHEQDRILSFLAARTEYSQDVDDLAQETFVLAWQKLKSLDDAAAFSGWLLAIAKNLLRNHHRKHARLSLAEPDQIAQWLEQKLSEENEGEEVRLSRLRQCLLKLDHLAQKTLRLYYREGYSLQEIRESMGIGHSTLTMRLNRYRKKLRECINRGR